MASVTGVTAEGIDQLLSTLIDSLRLDVNGQLIYRTRAGLETNVGVISDTQAAVEKAWPVGSIFMSTISANPNVQLGNVGTWVRWGKGRIPVSLDDLDTTFDTPEETGGVKEVTLSANQSGTRAHGHTVAGTVNSAGISARFHEDPANSNADSIATIHRGYGSTAGAVRPVSDSEHAHTFTGTVSSVPASAALEAHTNLQPYIVCYMWKRTV